MSSPFLPSSSVLLIFSRLFSIRETHYFSSLFSLEDECLGDVKFWIMSGWLGGFSFPGGGWMGEGGRVEIVHVELEPVAHVEMPRR